jgi:chromate transporter
MNDTEWALARVFVPLSLVSFGGGRTIIPDMETQAVTIHHWMTHREFIEIFAISRAAPGPGITMVTLIGWKADGWAGALAASLAIYVPAALLVIGAALVWRRYAGAPWRERLERALAPIAIGLIMAGGYVVLDAMGGGALTFGVAILSAAALMWRRIHPLLALGGGGCIYAIVFLLR